MALRAGAPQNLTFFLHTGVLRLAGEGSGRQPLGGEEPGMVCTEFNVEELMFFSLWFCRHSPRPEWAAAGGGVLAHRHKGLNGGAGEKGRARG